MSCRICQDIVLMETSAALFSARKTRYDTKIYLIIVLNEAIFIHYYYLRFEISKSRILLNIVSSRQIKLTIIVNTFSFT